MTNTQPPPRDNVGIANRAAAELDHMSPLTASPAFEKIALRGILHALLALVDAQAPAEQSAPRTRKPAAPKQEASK